MNWKALLPPYPSSTVMGLSVVVGAACSVLLDQATPKQAAAAALAGLVAVLLKQSTAGVTVSGGTPVVNADTATVTAAAGSTTTIKG